MVSWEIAENRGWLVGRKHEAAIRGERAFQEQHGQANDNGGIANQAFPPSIMASPKVTTSIQELKGCFEPEEPLNAHWYVKLSLSRYTVYGVCL